MSVPVKHHTKGKVGRRRSHHALKPTTMLACTSCKAPVLAHRVCGYCGAVQTRKTRAAASSAPREEKVAAPAKKEEAVTEEPVADDEALEEVAESETADESEEVAADEADTAPDEPAKG